MEGWSHRPSKEAEGLNTAKLLGVQNRHLEAVRENHQPYNGILQLEEKPQEGQWYLQFQATRKQSASVKVKMNKYSSL